METCQNFSCKIKETGTDVRRAQVIHLSLQAEAMQIEFEVHNPSVSELTL